MIHIQLSSLILVNSSIKVHDLPLVFTSSIATQIAGDALNKNEPQRSTSPFSLYKIIDPLR